MANFKCNLFTFVIVLLFFSTRISASTLVLADRPCDTIYTVQGDTILAESAEVGRKSVYYFDCGSNDEHRKKIKKRFVKSIGFGRPPKDIYEQEQATAFQRIKWAYFFSCIVVGFVLLAIFASYFYVFFAILALIVQFIFAKRVSRFTRSRPYLVKEGKIAKKLFAPVRVIFYLLLTYVLLTLVSLITLLLFSIG